MSREIEDRIAQNDRESARRLINEALVEKPASNWLLTRLALTYYEQRDYERALELEEQAVAIDPDCPLVLWDYAGSLEMLERTEDSLAAYKRITERSIDSLDYDQCGERRARARRLYADGLYRMSHFYLDRSDKAEAIQLLKQHLERCEPGCQFIYPIADVRKELRALEAEGSLWDAEGCYINRTDTTFKTCRWCSQGT